LHVLIHSNQSQNFRKTKSPIIKIQDHTLRTQIKHEKVFYFSIKDLVFRKKWLLET
jgi:hypothetical protein